MNLKIRSGSKMTPEYALNFLNNLIDFDNTSFEYKKNLINSLVKSVTIYNNNIIVDLNDNDLNISFYMDDSDTKAARSTTSPSCPTLYK